jgi:glycosyltransferase involved in cell wall biosynthesis
MNKITVTILTKNSSKYLRKVLDALTQFDEVLIFDNGSKDNSLAVAKEYPNVNIIEGEFEGFGPTHNRASSLAKNNWILSIDSDEVVTPEMSKEVLTAMLEDDCAYSFPRHNFFNERWIRWCGWYPDRQVRLYNRTMTKFTDAQVHEAIIVDNLRSISFESPIIHYSYETISDFLSKMQSYSTLFAAQNCGKKKSSPMIAMSHGMFAFFKSYILKRGILGGYEGFVISSYNAHTAFYKYLKLYEANTRQ